MFENKAIWLVIITIRTIGTFAKTEKRIKAL